LGIILIVAFAWKGLLLAWHAFPFNSDEAIVALMAKHILAGERPIFFYGQAYMGSLDAYLVALGFMILGQKVIVIRIVQSILYGLTILCTYFIGKMAFQSSKIGLIAALMLAFPTVNGTLYTTISLGGYGEACLIGSLLLYLAFKNQADLQESKPIGMKMLIFGFLTGLGIWVHGITLIFSLPAGLYLVYYFYNQKGSRQNYIQWLGLGMTGFVLGLLPILFYVFQHGVQTVWAELFGSAVAVETGFWLATWLSHLFSLVLFGIPVLFGMRPPWTTTIQQLYFFPLLIGFLVVVGFILYRELRTRTLPAAGTLCIAILLLLFATFIGTSFGIDPSGRYFVPLMIPGALLAGYAISKLMANHKAWGLLIACWCVYQIAVTGSLALKPPYLTTQFYTPAMVDHGYNQQLIDFLHENELTTGYTNYWVAYPLAFLSGEELIYVPQLPYHPDLRFTERDNRYLPYLDKVTGSTEISYIVTRNPELDENLVEQFTQAGIDYSYQEIGDYHIYYHLSSDIRPDELGFSSQD